MEDGRFDYVETGSLLGVRAREVPSYPVGFEERLRMHPLDFEEFCWASGVQKETIETLRTHFDDRTPIPEAIHQTMLGLYYMYVHVHSLATNLALRLNSFLLHTPAILGGSEKLLP